MPPVESLLILSTATLAGLTLVGGFAAWGWSGWLRLKTRELEAKPNNTAELPAIGQRIDLADLKERIRKLEAIAAGVDL
ncbi:hypothetical protein [Sandarakinorhabdus oryzae]|uniref:hypothetical protein n=1 Tax=Sandarakinorhabdus oryzae TaxID=2675220 RepID=UPI0012E1FEF7|nr:hypothetical protein [Sandarakinorhabdus oryzae]